MTKYVTPEEQKRRNQQQMVVSKEEQRVDRDFSHWYFPPVNGVPWPQCKYKEDLDYIWANIAPENRGPLDELFW